MKDLIIVAAGVGVFYAGRIRQWWVGRNDRKTTDALTHISDVLNKHNDKKGGQS